MRINMVKTLKNMIHIMNKVEPKNVGLYLLFKNRNNNKKTKWEIRQMKTQKELADTILNMNIRFLSEIIKQKSLEVIDYSPGQNNDKNIIEKIKAEDLPHFTEIKNLLDRNCSPLPHNSKVKYYKPIAYIIKLDVLQSRNFEKSIITFQYLTNQKILKKGGFIKRFNDEFKKLEEEKLFYIHNNFDCLYFKDENDNNKSDMYIFNKQHLDWIFGFAEIFKEEIEREFEENNEKYNDLINIDEFRNYVLKDYILTRKTYKVLKNENFKKYFNRKIILKVEKEAKISKLEWNEDDKLIINKDNVKKILNIVNEDYLKSVVSDNIFRSLSKTNLN